MPDIKWRILISVLILVCYFLLLRPAREQVNVNILYPLLEESVEKSTSDITILERNTVSTLIEWVMFSESKELYLKVPFGLNFLLGLIGLVLLNAAKRYYWLLLAIQLTGGILALFFFYIGTVSAVNFLIVTDLIARYLIPLCSLGVVPLAFIQKTQVYEEKAYRTS